MPFYLHGHIYNICKMKIKTQMKTQMQSQETRWVKYLMQRGNDM